MRFQRLQTKEAYSDFVIQEADIDASFDALADTFGALGSWTLGVVNITNIQYSYASIAINGEAYGKWFRIATTGKTCETNYDDCIANGGWKAILKRSKASPPFSIRIGTEPDEFGNSRGLEFLAIAPDRKYDGGLIGIA